MRAIVIAGPVLAAALLAAACGGSSSSSSGAAEPAAAEPAAAEPAAAEPAPAAGAPLERDLPTLVAKAVEMFEAMAAALSAGGDCPAQATKLRGLQDQYRPVIDAARKVETDGRGAEIERLLMPHEERLKIAVEKMRPSVETCMQDPDFQRAFADLTGS